MSETPTYGRWLAEQRGNKTPGSRRLWDPLEEAQLRREVAQGVPWRDIALRHGRSVGAVQLRARKVTGDG